MAQVRAQQDYRISAVLKKKIFHLFDFPFVTCHQLSNGDMPITKYMGPLVFFQALDIVNLGGLSAGQFSFFQDLFRRGLV